MTEPRNETTGDTLVFDWDLDHPPERVWKALTDPALVARWLGPSDIRPEVGRLFSIRAAPGHSHSIVAGGLELMS